MPQSQKPQSETTRSSSPRPHDASRRDFLCQSLAAGAALAAPLMVSSKVLGLDGAAAPSNKITLGVIGIGPRCTYDLKGMLPFPDVQCVAIADVQASRRDAGKALVDRALRQQGLPALSATFANCWRGKTSTRC